VNWGLFFVFFAQTFLTPFLIPQWLRGSVILMGQVSKHTNLSPINTAFQCLLLCVHFSLTPFICFLSCLSFCGDLLQYSGLGDWMRCQRLVSSEHPEQMPYTNKLKRQPRRPQKKKTLSHSLSPHQRYWHWSPLKPLNVQLAQREGLIPKLIWTGDVQNSTAPLDMFLLSVALFQIPHWMALL